MSDGLLRGLVAVCLVLWTTAVVLVTIQLAAPHPAPVRLDLRVTVTSTTAPVVLQEDDPGWDCRTMGDRVCG